MGTKILIVEEQSIEANDLKMMGVAGLGVAFNAKVRVQRNAPTRLNSPSMLDVLYLLGFNADDISQLLEVDHPRP